MTTDDVQLLKVTIRLESEDSGKNRPKTVSMWTKYAGEDPANMFWYQDGYRRETTVTCKDCNATSDLKLIEGDLVCSWHRFEARRWADLHDGPREPV